MKSLLKNKLLLWLFTITLFVFLSGCFGGGDSGGSGGGGGHDTSTVLSFNPSSLSVDEGQSSQVTLKLTPKSNNEAVTMLVKVTSSDSAFVTVSPSECNLSTTGASDPATCQITVHGVTSGNANVVATEPNGDRVTLPVHVTGNPQTPNKVVFSTTASVVQVGLPGTVKLTLANPDSSANLNLNLSSSDSHIATVSPNSCNLSKSNPNCDVTINGLGLGSSIITASGDNSKTILPVQVVANDGSRHITIVNKCGETVWLGMIGASSNGIKAAGGEPSALCGASDPQNKCPQGSSCIKTGKIYQCFWNNPTNATLVKNKYALSPGEVTTVEVPADSLNPTEKIVWDGVFVARQGCNTTTGVCQVANCPVDGNMGCKAGTGATPPASQAELTMRSNNVDFYDVELINGANLPISVGPNNQVYPTKVPKGGAYYCTSPGFAFEQVNPLSPGNIPAAHWDFSTPSPSYNLVDNASSATCSTDSTCQKINSNYVCGYDRKNSGFNGPITSAQTTCGNRLGYLTAFEVCGNSPASNYAPFFCNTTQPGTVYSNNQFYQCLTPLKTGYPNHSYQESHIAQVCGSTNWSGIANPKIFKYQYVNPVWTSLVLPKITWLKQACPSCYTYSFDDPSSTFICGPNDLKAKNYTNYTVTFCPNKQ